jgi:signal transduction histidine kinase
LAHEGLAARRFAPRVESAAYRIVQEALTNVARHAGVKQATMQAWADADLLQLQVQDAGRGFDVNVPAASGHATGLCGMRERVNALAGHITIESTPGKGTCISIALPLPGVAEVQGGDQNPVGR